MCQQRHVLRCQELPKLLSTLMCDHPTTKAIRCFRHRAARGCGGGTTAPVSVAPMELREFLPRRLRFRELRGERGVQGPGAQGESRGRTGLRLEGLEDLSLEPSSTIAKSPRPTSGKLRSCPQYMYTYIRVYVYIIYKYIRERERDTFSVYLTPYLFLYG